MAEQLRWVAVSSRVPKDGQAVYVRGRYATIAIPMRFRAAPAARWESLDGADVYQLHYFEEWAEAPNRAKATSA